MTDSVSELLVNTNTTIRDCIMTMDRVRCAIVLIVDEAGKLSGVATNGDVRRAILAGVDLTSAIADVMNPQPVVIRQNSTAAEVEDVLRQPSCYRYESILLPILDDASHPIGLIDSNRLRNPAAAPRPLFSLAEKAQRVLLLGGAGYIGSALTRLLLAEGLRVSVFDKFLYGDSSLHGVASHPLLQVIRGDTRHVEELIPRVEHTDIVVHLAELVGDPLCAADGSATLATNYLATELIARTCAHLQVNRFIYVSSCSVYGASLDPDEILTENSSLIPVSLYAKMKIQAESAILSLGSETFSPCVLRLGTVFGMSYRPRFDLVVNLLSAKAVTEGSVDIHGGAQWRPHVHVRDVAAAIKAAIDAPIDLIRGQIFNVVGENRQIGELGNMIAEYVPGTSVNFHQGSVDRRNYRVSSARLKDTLGWKAACSVRQGIEEVVNAIRSGRIQDYKNQLYNNHLLPRATSPNHAMFARV